MSSETSEAVGTTWEHAQLEFQKFLKIRIPLPPICEMKSTQVILKARRNWNTVGSLTF